MGLTFDLRIANWLAHVVDSGAMPTLSNPSEEREALRHFLDALRGQFHSSRQGIQRFDDVLDRTEQLLASSQHTSSNRVLSGLRSFLRDRPWTALLIPSGTDSPSDQLMCSRGFLREIVDIEPDDPGLILQVDAPPEQVFTLTDVFPAFQQALAASTEWPGVLLWSRRINRRTLRSGDAQARDVVFLPVSGGSVQDLHSQIRWIFSQLSQSFGLDLGFLKKSYYREFHLRHPSAPITVLHLSDIHAGSRESRERLPRVQSILRRLVKDLGPYAENVIPLVTGDLMDTPNEDNVDRVRSFRESLAAIGTEDPIFLLGNHDVRTNGYISENLGSVLHLEGTSGQVKWFDKFSLGIACFNSVDGGKLARGFIGERQLLDMGSKLDAKCTSAHEFMVIGALHHHPIAVARPDWYMRPFYERLLGDRFARTDELEDASQFVNFVENRQIAAILHGHKHIPRINLTAGGVPVIGCGSSVGKVNTIDDGIFISLNLVTINRASGKISARLLAERIPGGGLEQYQSHEVVWSPQPIRTYRSNS